PCCARLPGCCATAQWLGSAGEFPKRKVASEQSRGYFCAGCKISFCMRQFRSSATNKVFSEGQEIPCTQPNWLSCLHTESRERLAQPGESSGNARHISTARAQRFITAS